MGFWSVAFAVTYSVGILVWVEVVDLRYFPPTQSLVTVAEMPPQAWERRFVQTSETTGQEVLLLRRSNEAGYWMATTATEGMVKIAVNDRRVVRTAIQGPRVGVAYSPIGALSAPARGALMTQADNFAANGTAGMRILTITHARTGVRRYLGMVLTTPAAGWRLVRWSMRRPTRALGFMAMMWLMTETLQAAGFFDYIREKVVRGQEAAQNVRDKVGEASEFAAEIIEVMRATYAGFEEYMAPWKLPFLVVAVWAIHKWFKDAEVSETPLSTPEVSPASSACETPPEDPQARAIESLGAAVASQHDMMEQVIQRLGDMQTKHNEDVDRALEKEMIRSARACTAAEDHAQRQGKSWEEMRSRMEHFERILKEDRGDAAGGPTLLSPAKSDEDTEAVKTQLPEVPRLPKEDGDMSILIRKLKRQAKTPQEVFVEALEDFAEQDKEMWATQFPPGYRERVAPSFLGEIYASGKTAKQWAKDWVRDKGLGDCNDAREIIPSCASIDSIFLVDQTSGAINQINVERLARKVLGIKYGFADVSKESDWKKPANAKTWKSRIDKETWKRMDPNVEDKDHIFMTRKAEDEMRTEMDRDAAMLKAKAKLADRDGR